MSYDVAIVTPPIPADDSAAWNELDALLASHGSVPPVLRTLHDQLIARYPCLSSLPDDQLDDAVWSDGPLWNNFCHRGASLGVSSSRVEEVLPFLIETANAIDLVVFDLSAEQIHRADRINGLNLTVEDRRPLQAPTLQQVYSAVDALTSRGGPGFLILEGAGEDYAQAAGGDGTYTAEWREYSGNHFRHFVAGVFGVPSEKEITIPTNGFEVTVKENERIGTVEVKEILAAFAERKTRPSKFAWRDVTKRFAE
jgi:hypothetical protein